MTITSYIYPRSILWFWMTSAPTSSFTEYQAVTSWYSRGENDCNLLLYLTTKDVFENFEEGAIARIQKNVDSWINWAPQGYSQSTKTSWNSYLSTRTLPILAFFSCKQTQCTQYSTLVCPYRCKFKISENFFGLPTLKSRRKHQITNCIQGLVLGSCVVQRSSNKESSSFRFPCRVDMFVVAPLLCKQILFQTIFNSNTAQSNKKKANISAPCSKTCNTIQRIGFRQF